MKIHALRVAHFRRFSDAVAIEDFAGGLNVLAGPNEMGKSTFFHALEAAFMTRHKVTGSALDHMRPYSGGEPLVEADISHNDRQWRIRKQFGRGNSAVLTDLASGRIIARNAEAEDELSRLLGRTGDLPGPLGLVWVKQQRMLQAPDPDFDGAQGKEKPRGERSALQAAISQEVDTAAGGAVFNRVQHLTGAALDVNLTPTRNAPRKNGPLDMARRRREETRAALELARRAAAAFEQRISAIGSAMSELAHLSAPERVMAQANERQGLETELATEVRRRTERDLAREALKAAISEADAARQRLQAERSRQDRRTALAGRRSEALALEGVIATFTAELNSDAARPERLEELEALCHVCAIADAELGADAPRVDIDVMPGGAGRVRVNGSGASGQSSIAVPEKLNIEIDGIAAIRVTAPGAERAAAARVRLDKAKSAIANILHDIGVASIEQARDRAIARQQRAADLERARAKLSGLAPQGAAALASELDGLVPDGGLPEDGKNLEAAVREKSDALALAQDRFDRITALVKSDDAFRDLSRRLEAVKRDMEAAAGEIARLNLRVETLKSEQAGADEDGRAGQVANLEGELELCDNEVKRLEADGMALLLLANTLKKIETEARAAYSGPVERALQPHLQSLFGKASAGFRNSFSIGGLTRDGQAEDYPALSDGTREQLSVLVRMSFAEVFANQGMAVPLVLDDPLVYSDDERLARMCRGLETAAQKMQVIILTCRASAFQTLSGHRVSITAWRPEN